MKRVFLAAAAAAAVASPVGAGSAKAAVVLFAGYPATTFADGTFSTNLSGWGPDGFYSYYLGPTSAVNGYGQNGEFIRFNKPVTLRSLSIGKCNFCYDSHPSTFTVNLYGGGGAGLVRSATVAASSTPETILLNTHKVEKVEFTFDAPDGFDVNGDGKPAAWYIVSDVTYNLGVAEPAVWMLMIGGVGSVGAALRRRRAAAA